MVKAGHVHALFTLASVALPGKPFLFFSFFDILLLLPGYLFHKSLPGLWACMDPPGTLF